MGLARRRPLPGLPGGVDQETGIVRGGRGGTLLGVMPSPYPCLKTLIGQCADPLRCPQVPQEQRYPQVRGKPPVMEITALLRKRVYWPAV